MGGFCECTATGAVTPRSGRVASSQEAAADAQVGGIIAVKIFSAFVIPLCEGVCLSLP